MTTLDITNNRTSAYDDWDDVYNYREYLNLGINDPESNVDGNNNGGCGHLIFWGMFALLLFYWWLFKLLKTYK